MRFSSALASIAALSTFWTPALAETQGFADRDSFADDLADSLSDERRELLQNAVGRLKNGERNLKKSGRKSKSSGAAAEDEIDSITDIIDEIIDLLDDPEGGCDELAAASKKKSKKKSKSATTCEDFFDLAEELLLFFQTVACHGGPDEDFIPDLIEIITRCGGEVGDALDTEPRFCPETFDDGTYGGTVSPGPITSDLSFNQYAWAADFNEECGVGVMVHSAGTSNLLGGDITYPTFTLRDENGDAIYHGVSEVPFAGIRSALVIGCNGDTVTVLAADINEVHSFLLYEFDTSLTTSEENPDGAFPIDEGIPGISSSVRSMLQISEETVLYAPLFDLEIEDIDEIFPFLAFLDLDNEEIIEPIEIRDENGNRIDDHTVWDFKCDDELCWVNIVTLEGPECSVDIVPKLFYFYLEDVLDLCDSNVENCDDGSVNAVEVNFEPENDFAAYSLLPLEDDNVLVCTLSGFVYEGGINDDCERRRKLQFGDLDGLNEIGLGYPQECSICSANGKPSGCSGGKCAKGGTKTSKAGRELSKKSKSSEAGQCVPVGMPSQSPTNAYIWSLNQCGGYVFAASLDLANLIGTSLVFGLVSDIADLTCSQFAPGGPGCFADSTSCSGCVLSSIYGFLLGAARGVYETLQALLLSLLFNDFITPDDFGYDMWYMNTNDLCDDAPEFMSLTTNGFRDVLNPGGAQIDILDPLWFYGHDPASPIHEGVRNMVCHVGNDGCDAKLVVGTANLVLGDSIDSSNTTVLHLNEDQCIE